MKKRKLSKDCSRSEKIEWEKKEIRELAKKGR